MSFGYQPCFYFVVRINVCCQASKSSLKVNVLIPPSIKNKILNINCNNVPGVLPACPVNSMLMNDQAALQWRAHGCSNAR